MQSSPIAFSRSAKDSHAQMMPQTVLIMVSQPLQIRSLQTTIVPVSHLRSSISEKLAMWLTRFVSKSIVALGLILF
jgi:hypothetical protein